MLPGSSKIFLNQCYAVKSKKPYTFRKKQKGLENPVLGAKPQVLHNWPNHLEVPKR